MTPSKQTFLKWLAFGTGMKRWLALVIIGLLLVTMASASLFSTTFTLTPLESFFLFLLGVTLVILSFLRFVNALLAPYRRVQQGEIIDLVMEHQRRSRGFKLVAIGGGTGLPVTLRGMKAYTGNITAIVTVADDGGSSGRLRRELGVAPPGDLRNNIVALADDDSLMAQLFQHRFHSGDLNGHAFGNLFIATLAEVVDTRNPNSNSLAEALVEIERILNIKGRVLPATLDDVQLAATVRLRGTERVVRVLGESQIGEIEGAIETISLYPENITAYTPSVKAILEADMVVIGPGSLYTSILPNLMVKEIADALRATRALKIYVCNVATQPVETEEYTVAEHIMALEKHIGRGVFQSVVANNVYPSSNAGANTHYVMPAPANHEVLQRYELRYADLTDDERPWRHDPKKLARVILDVSSYRTHEHTMRVQ